MPSQQLAIIENSLRSREVQQNLILSLGLSPEDEKGQNAAFQYINSVLEQVKKTEGDKYGDLTLCTPQSICRTMIDAAKLQISIDARQHAHIVKFNNQAQLQIGYRGYIAKISEYYKNADFTAEAIFNGDGLIITQEDGLQSYELKKLNPFADKWDDLIGVLVQMSYTKGGKFFQKVQTVSKGDLVKIRAVAKQDSVWSKWPIEKAKAAAIKRASKIQFADVTGLQNMIQYDNEMNFDLSKQNASPIRRSIVDNINESISPLDSEIIEYGHQQPIDITHVSVQEVGDNSETVIQQPQRPPILGQAFMEAKKGEKHFTAWVIALPESDKEILRVHRRTLSAEAKMADLNNTDQPLV